MQLFPALEGSNDPWHDTVIATLHAVVVTWHAAMGQAVDDKLLEGRVVMDEGEEEEEEGDHTRVLDEQLVVWFVRCVKDLGEENKMFQCLGKVCILFQILGEKM